MSIDLSGLNPRQLEAVHHRDGPLLVLAGAGSGKTRVVTVRIARIIDSGISPTAILAVTFTNKAAREMAERLARIVGPTVARGVTVATFHAFGVQLLRREITRLGFRERFAILDHGDQLATVRRLLKEQKADLGRFPPDEVLGQISFCRNTGKTMGELRRSGDPLRQITARIWPLYDQARRTLNAVDFDDLLLLPLQLLREHPDLLAACRERYRYLLVDEYQDTNSQQLELVRLLAGERANLCVVGDDDQSIYGWRGAQPANILEFERHFSGTKIVTLEQNYRSTQQILQVANKVIEHNPTRRAKVLWSQATGRRKVALWDCRDPAEEAARVVRAIRIGCSGQGRKPSDFGILYRTNAQAQPFELELADSRLPYRVVGGTKFFDRKEIRDLIAYLRVLHDPFDEVALLRCINTPPRSIGATTLQRLVEAANSRQLGLWTICHQAAAIPGVDARAASAIGQFVELVERYRKRCGGRADARAVGDLITEIRFRDDLLNQSGSPFQGARRLDNVDALLARLEQHGQREDPSLQGFLDAATLDTDQLEDDEVPQDAVTLMTLHSAKGLEFPIVFFVGMEEGLLPFKHATEGANIDEERRLCYVGITRAREELTLTYARLRTRGSERIKQARTPSRFIKEIDPELLAQPGEDHGRSEEQQRLWVADRLAELHKRL